MRRRILSEPSDGRLEAVDEAVIPCPAAVGFGKGPLSEPPRLGESPLREDYRFAPEEQKQDVRQAGLLHLLRSESWDQLFCIRRAKRVSAAPVADRRCWPGVSAIPALAPTSPVPCLSEAVAVDRPRSGVTGQRISASVHGRLLVRTDHSGH